MGVDFDGKRPRLFHERARVEAQQGNPLKARLSQDARLRLIREIEARAKRWEKKSASTVPYASWILTEVRRVFGLSPETTSLKDTAEMKLEEFLSVLEIGANVVYQLNEKDEDIAALQSILADDLCAYRYVRVDSDPAHAWQIQLIDNEHLHREIVDRTFELTRNGAFDSAQRDYAEAWKHYSRGDFDDALVNAHKAFESACKVIIKRVDPASAPENMQTNQLVPLLVSLDIIPQRLQHSANHIGELLKNSGTLRNNAGTGHGSIDLASPEASIALLGLRLSGTYVSFLATRWEQMKPKS